MFLGVGLIGGACGVGGRSGACGLAQCASGDDQLLDLRRALVDAQETDVAVETLDLILGHIAGTAVDLDRAVGDPAHRLGRVIFERGAFEAGGLQ